MPPLTEIHCPRGDAAPEGSSRALWRQCSAPQGHAVPSPHQLSFHSPGLYQAAGDEQGHCPATMHRETEAEEGPDPTSQSRRHPYGLILGTGLPPCHHHAHSPHHSPTAESPVPPQNHMPKVAAPSPALLPPPKHTADTSLLVVQPLQHRWVRQPCPLPQGCSLRRRG